MIKMEILDIKQFQTELPGKKLFVKGEIEFKVWNNSKALNSLVGVLKAKVFTL